jgi:hypothetical protein
MSVLLVLSSVFDRFRCRVNCQCCPSVGLVEIVINASVHDISRLRFPVPVSFYHFASSFYRVVACSLSSEFRFNFEFRFLSRSRSIVLLIARCVSVSIHCLRSHFVHVLGAIHVPGVSSLGVNSFVSCRLSFEAVIPILNHSQFCPYTRLVRILFSSTFSVFGYSSFLVSPFYISSVRPHPRMSPLSR